MHNNFFVKMLYLILMSTVKFYSVKIFNFILINEQTTNDWYFYVTQQLIRENRWNILSSPRPRGQCQIPPPPVILGRLSTGVSTHFVFYGGWRLPPAYRLMWHYKNFNTRAFMSLFFSNTLHLYSSFFFIYIYNFSMVKSQTFNSEHINAWMQSSIKLIAQNKFLVSFLISELNCFLLTVGDWSMISLVFFLSFHLYNLSLPTSWQH